MKTNMASSYTSSPRYVNDTDFDDVDSLDLDDDRDFDENFTDEGKCTEKKLICTFIKSVVCIGAKHAASTVTCLPVYQLYDYQKCAIVLQSYLLCFVQYTSSIFGDCFYLCLGVIVGFLFNKAIHSNFLHFNV